MLVAAGGWRVAGACGFTWVAELPEVFGWEVLVLKTSRLPGVWVEVTVKAAGVAESVSV